MTLRRLSPFLIGFGLTVTFPGCATHPRTGQGALPNALSMAFVPGKLTVTSKPSGADVLYGGKVIGHTPLTLTDVIPGRQSVEVRLHGYCSQTMSGEVVAKKSMRLNAILEKFTGPEGGQTWMLPRLDLVLLPIAAGTFQMGSENGDVDEKPLTRVTITKPYWLGKTEVTRAQWQALMGSNPSNFKGDDRPVEKVSWDDAMAFCQKLTERERAAGRLPEGYAYTLPTEAQWEYACRAGTTGDYAGDLNSMAWYSSNSEKTMHPVGTKQPNAWGLCDMHCNVWEWCADWKDDYPGGSATDPMGPSSGSLRAIRGGGWRGGASDCRSANRFGYDPGSRFNFLGFRLALSSVR